MIDYGIKFRELRKAINLMQQQLSTRHVSQSCISLFECGYNIGVYALLELLDKMDVELAEFFDENYAGVKKKLIQKDKVIRRLLEKQVSLKALFNKIL